MKPQSICSFIMMLFTIAAVAMMPVSASAEQTGVSYLERTWSDSEKKIVEEERTCADYSTVSSLGSAGGTLTPGFWVVDTDVSVSGSLQTSGEVRLILCDGKTLSVTEGIYVADGSTFTVYTEKDDSGKIDIDLRKSEEKMAAIGGRENGIAGNIIIKGGELEVVGSDMAAGIGGGGGEGSSFRSITINGGTINAWGGYDGAAIGTGENNSNPGTITINGGTVNATARSTMALKNGAGIGGGNNRSGGTIIINGGKIDSEGIGQSAGIGGGSGGDGGNITINGGTVRGKGHQDGAGIGGGSSHNGGTITINGGYVYGNAGSTSAGIGGGSNADGGIITINGGYVEGKSDPENINSESATISVSGAAIGGGKHGSGGTIRINGGTVSAIGQYSFGAAIGGGYDGSTGDIVIKDSTVTAYGGSHGGAAIGSGKDGDNDPAKDVITITNSTVQAYGPLAGTEAGSAGIGGGYDADSGKITITDSTVIATGGVKGGAGIGAGYAADQLGVITITGSTVTATGTGGGAGIGAGYEGEKSQDGGKGGQVNINHSTITVATQGKNGGSSGAMLIGAGEDESEDTVTIVFDDHKNGTKVTAGSSEADAAPALKDDRRGALKNINNNWAKIEPCDHTDGRSYSRKDKDVHTVENCKWCGEEGGTDETHTLVGDVCSKCGQQFAVVRFDPNNGQEETQVIFTAEEAAQSPAITIPEAVEFKPYSLIFDCWKDLNTLDEYEPGENYTVTKSVTFRAMTQKANPILFDPNGGTIEGSTEKYLFGKYADSDLPVTINLMGKPTPPAGKAFKSWNTRDGAVHYAGNPYTVEGAVTFTAQYVSTYQISYYPNNGTGEEQPFVQVVEPQEEGGTAYFSIFADAPETAPEGKNFAGWKKEGDDSGKIYPYMGSAEADGPVSFEAVWQDNPVVSIQAVDIDGPVTGIEPLCYPIEPDMTYQDLWTAHSSEIMEHFSSAETNDLSMDKEHPLIGKPLSEYNSSGDLPCVSAVNDAFGKKEIGTANVTICVPYLRSVGSIDISVELPACGTESATNRIPDNSFAPNYNYNTQTNRPVVSVPEGAGYSIVSDPAMTYWVVPDGENADPYTFTFGDSIVLGETHGRMEIGYYLDSEATVQANDGVTAELVRNSQGEWTGKVKLQVSVEHDYEAGDIVREPTCTVEGSRKYICSKCGKTTVKSIPTNRRAHDWGDWTAREDGKHERVCRYDESHVQTAEHVYGDGNETQAPSCGQPGKVVYTCEVCGCQKTESIEALGHDWRFAGFTWTGNETDGYTAAAANYVCKNDENHAQTADAAVTSEEFSAACEEEGKTIYKASVSAGNSLDKTAHEDTKAGKIQAAAGHRYGDWEYVDAGVHQRICANDAAHVEKAAHTWDNGKVTTKATAEAEGVKTYTCTVCGGTKTETIPKTDPAQTEPPKEEPQTEPPREEPQTEPPREEPQTGPTKEEQTDEPDPADKSDPADKPEPVVEPQPAEDDKEAETKQTAPLLAQMTSAGRNKLKLKWSKVEKADGYDIFMTICSSRKNKLVKTVKGNKKFTWTAKGLKAKQPYKACVKAYLLTKSGKKEYISKSPSVHGVTAGSMKKITNPKKVTVNRKKVTLQKGKTFKIKAKIVPLEKGKKLLPAGHGARLRYLTDNKKIASVSKKGVVKAKSAGKCTVYVIAINGIRRTIRVTVKGN